MSARTSLRRLREDRDALFTLVLAQLLILLSGGLLYLWRLYQVWSRARRAPTAVPRAELILVLGHRLTAGDQLSRLYRQRLARARALLQAHPGARALLLGGLTGGRISEAEAGRRYLAEHGIAEERLLLEEQSGDTLQNLVNARSLLARAEDERVLITSRFHLARALALTEGLNLGAHPCAADERLGAGSVPAMLLEAMLLHWYYTGRRWSLLTNNRRMLDRIT
ncbi:YdcF family protein [Alkalilimnicola sp. S0819]|uniref:YdcF family protein n=1 Tax=Alkalilimnicola sp. S0819 TaxID=2613922 RepID=UPI001261AE2B|nr:YdcF family protein [Alkalilimnicola sp. S0819]KAB7624186.1 YdcF family protein [Alkalilimnicola sp. S0819]MPQ16441.1 YdcF family protein [Alkalilimnicola sp. S0819]